MSGVAAVRNSTIRETCDWASGWSLFSAHRKREVEGGPGILGTFRPRASAMPMNDALHVGQANAGAFKFTGPVQALKDAKQFVHVFHVESDAVVANMADDFVGLGPAPDFNPGPGARARVFDRVGEQVDEHLTE